MSVRIKFCGITRVADAQTAVALGADALGFVFYPPSPRAITPSAAAAIVRALPPFVCKVGLFVNAAPATVAATVETAGLDIVQYHGDESPEDCARAPRPWIKAFRVRADLDLAAACAPFGAAAAWLFDTYDEQLYGGSGRSFDWGLLPAERRRPIVLAGGLAPDNVAEAVRRTAPYAVDVSGGIEAAKGIKDQDKMRKFIAEVKRVERQT
ncbi:MAG: phosphoribosylanthranilate isomerase [Gammaproteobacteria bacterium]